MVSTKQTLAKDGKLNYYDLQCVLFSWCNIPMKKDAKKLRQKKRKKRELKKNNHDKDFFLKLTGVDAETNSYYALQENDEFSQVLERADKAIPKAQEKETRDHALDYLVRCIILNMNRMG